MNIDDRPTSHFGIIIISHHHIIWILWRPHP